MACRDREALEALWLERLNRAKSRADFAHCHVMAVKKDIAANALSPADGHLALVSAVRAENVALEEFHQVLNIFADLVVKGIKPKEND